MADGSSFQATLNESLHSFVKYVASNPQEFLFYVFLILTPLMVISGILSLKLAKHIEQSEKDKKKKATRQSNIAKSRRRVKAE